MYHIQENHGVIIMQKRVLLNLVAIAFSVCLLVACSSDSGADSNVIEVPAKGNVALESSFDFKVLKSCDDVKGLSLVKSEDKSGMENEDDFDYDDFERFLNDRFTNENVDFYVNEDGSATVTKNLFVDCGGVNTIDYEIVNDTLSVSAKFYIWKNIYNPEIGDSVLTKTGHIQGSCRSCESELELNVPPKFVGAKYLDDGLVYNIVYKKR